MQNTHMNNNEGYEMVNHPTHYNVKGKKECIEAMVDDLGIDVAIGFCLGNAYKYRYRAGEKPDNSAEQDFKKAEWYEKKGKEFIERKKNNTQINSNIYY